MYDCLKSGNEHFNIPDDGVLFAGVPVFQNKPSKLAELHLRRKSQLNKESKFPIKKEELETQSKTFQIPLLTSLERKCIPKIQIFLSKEKEIKMPAKKSNSNIKVNLRIQLPNSTQISRITYSETSLKSSEIGLTSVSSISNKDGICVIDYQSQVSNIVPRRQLKRPSVLTKD